MRPLFSIVIPVYNRANYIARAINSCINQSFDNFEIILIDDGSIDDSVSVINSYDDVRIKLYKHARNLGVGPARNSGVDIANGEWIVCLDSDDELTKDSLNLIASRIKNLESGIDGLRFSCMLDDGRCSPDPVLGVEVWDFKKFLCWMEGVQHGLQETMPVVRRNTFKICRYEQNRALEMAYHLNFSKNFLIKTFPDIVRLYHGDAGNQLTKSSFREILKSASNQSKSVEEIIRLHGNSLQTYSPTVYKNLLNGSVTLHLLSGSRLYGLMAFLRYKKVYSVERKMIAVILIGTVSRTALAIAKSYMQK